MPIFTIDDLATFLPNITLTGAAFDAFALQIQTIIESPLGANMSLDMQVHKETLRINRTHQTVYLSNTPIDLSATPVIRARIGNAVAAVSGNVIPQRDWREIDSNQYQLDEDTGKLSLFTNKGGALTYAYGSANLGYQTLFTEVQAEYTAGFDFTDTSNPLVNQIKANAAAIARYVYGDRGKSAYNGKQKRSEDINEDYKVGYFAGASGTSDGLYGTGQGQIPKSLMQYFINMQPVAYGL